MTLPHLLWIGLLTIVLQTGVRTAQATHRADFFDVSRRPTVQYDRGKQTWTMRNQAVERVLHFDAKTGALQTVSLRDVRHGHAVAIAPGSEGAISFAPMLAAPPTLLDGWKVTDTAPPDGWAQPSYNDSAWKPVTLPFKTDQENKTWWFRCALPSGLMDARHSYALLLDHAIDDEAEVYVDGMLAQKIHASEQPWNRNYQVDLSAGSRVIAIKLTGHGKPNGLLGTISVGQVGSSPPALDLNSDWHYVLHSINANEDGSKIPTISLSGVKRYEGFDLDINYQIYPGDEPYMAKWFNFTSHRSSRFLIDEVTYDRWLLPDDGAEVQSYPGTGFAASSMSPGDGILTAVLSPMGASERSADGKSVAPVLHPNYAIQPNGPVEIPKSLLAVYQGPAATGAFLYQLYIGQYLAHATPISVPPLYNTRSGYGGDINAATCEKIIPMAADLGVKLFVLDDGWQTNSRPDSGRYGDWMTDRRENKFPKGLAPISLLVRENKMRFGLWTAPILVGDMSQAAVQHPNWLLRQPGNAFVTQGEGTKSACFTTGWAENYTESMRSLCRETIASYLKLDGGLFFDSCVNPAHDHTLGHAMPDQIESWTTFCQILRKLDPNFIVDRGAEDGPEVTGMQDEGWFGNGPSFLGPRPSADARGWYHNADISRQTLYDIASTRPPFTIAAETPCHIPTNPVDLNALEYHFTSVGAYISNVEIQGKLEEMTGPERDLLKKWIQWNEDNRLWLAYAQPIAGLGKPWDPRDANARPHIDGVLHLRNVLEGRYGYLCLWNPADNPDKASVTINPADYMVKMNPKEITITRLKDGSGVPFTASGSAIHLDLSLSPRSWEIYEIRARK